MGEVISGSSKKTYEERQAEAIKNKTKIFKAYCKELKKGLSSLKLYKFTISIRDKNQQKVNWDRGIYSIADIYFKKLTFGIMSPNFDNEYNPTKIESLSLRYYQGRDVVDLINSSLYFQKKERIDWNKDHKDIQSCLDELERLRKICKNFFS